jgi:hypothetical protein
MTMAPFVNRALAGITFVGVLAVLRLMLAGETTGQWGSSDPNTRESPRAKLTVGYLPVT